MPPVSKSGVGDSGKIVERERVVLHRSGDPVPRLSLSVLWLLMYLHEMDVHAMVVAVAMCLADLHSHRGIGGIFGCEGPAYRLLTVALQLFIVAVLAVCLVPHYSILVQLSSTNLTNSRN